MIAIDLYGQLERTVAGNALDAAGDLIDGGTTRTTDGGSVLLVNLDDATELIQVLEHAASYYRKTRQTFFRAAAERLAEQLAEAAAGRQGDGPGDWRDANVD